MVDGKILGLNKAKESVISRLLQCRHSIPALNAWAAKAEYTTARLIATQSPGHRCMDDLTTGRSFDSLRGSSMCLAYFFDMLPMGVCTTGHNLTPVRLMPELSADTVLLLNQKIH